MRRFMVTLISAVAALFTNAAAAEPFRTPHVAAEFHGARAAIAPGERFWVVLEQQIIPGWHTYWRNPGVAGVPTQIAWHLPPGFSAGDIQWPAPRVLPYADLINYGYVDDVLLPIELSAPRGLAPGSTVTLSADVSWLVCSDQCIPEQGTLTLMLPVAAQGRDDPAWASRIAATLADLPKPAPFAARITAPSRLSFALPDAAHARNPYFFSFSADKVNASASQHPRVGVGGLSFALTQAAPDANLTGEPLDGVLAFETQTPNGWARHAYEIHATPGAAIANTDAEAAATSADFVSEAQAAPPSAPSPATPPSAPSDVPSLAVGLIFAFLGGIILNIMPCVLPVLSIKALSFAGGAHSGEARRHGVLYLAGVLATFVALGAVLLALRGAGAAIGWGFQLQSPIVTSALSLLFFVIGLNLLGAFEFGGNLQGLGANLADRGGDLGAFFTGALAVVAATPCTAPFMASALGYALTQPAPALLAIFLALGLGFAAPMVALAFAPALQRLIPKPGAWMERVRNVLAFPMFATAIWLAWVLGEESGALGIGGLLSIALAIGFLVFVARWSKLWLAIGVAALALTAVIAAGYIMSERPAAAASNAWSAARVAQERAAGHGVFVNFTAAWCITCHANEAFAFTPRVKAAMAEKGIVYLEGDWTNRDSAIAAELAAHNRAGVPLYLYYAPNAAEPVVLPQLLTEGDVLNAIGR